MHKINDLSRLFIMPFKINCDILLNMLHVICINILKLKTKDHVLSQKWTFAEMMIGKNDSQKEWFSHCEENNHGAICGRVDVRLEYFADFKFITFINLIFYSMRKSQKKTLESHP